MDNKNIFTNPFNIKCEGCGAPAEYDIIHETYHCQFCGANTSLDAPVRTVQRYRSLHKEELRARKRQDTSSKYNCPNCGAIVVLDATEATGSCDFCGTKLVNSDFMESDAFPEMLIPFKITLEEAKTELEKWLKHNSSKQEAKKLAPCVKDIKGYYLPYQVVKGPVRCSVSRARSSRTYQCGGFIEEVAVNTSKQLDNLLLDAMEPFDWRELRPFEYGYIAGIRTKLQDTKEEDIAHRINNEVTHTYLPTIERELQTADLTINTDVSSVMQLPALMPVYILKRGDTACAINGQTGRVAVTPLKKKTVQYAWLEPLLTVLFVAGLCELVPLLLHYHPVFEITLGISLVTGLIVWAAYEGTRTVKKTVYLQSAKQLVKREGAKLTFTDGRELVENPALVPVFFEYQDNKPIPVKISFYSIGRAIKAGIFALVLAFFPNLLAWLITAYSVYVNGASPESFAKLHHFYAAAWWCLMIPCLFVLWIAIVRRDVFDMPLISRINPDGSTTPLESESVDLSFSDFLHIVFVPPFCWIALFILFMIAGCTAAILG